MASSKSPIPSTTFVGDSLAYGGCSLYGTPSLQNHVPSGLEDLQAYIPTTMNGMSFHKQSAFMDVSSNMAGYSQYPVPPHPSSPSIMPDVFTSLGHYQDHAGQIINWAI